MVGRPISRTYMHLEVVPPGVSGGVDEVLS